MISRAAGLSKDEIRALRNALRISQAENKQLKAENKTLREALKKISTKSASQQRQVRKSVQGQQVHSAVRKPMVSSVRVKAPKVNVEKQHKEQLKRADEVRRQELSNMSKEERRQYHLNNLYIPQFMERINNYFGLTGKLTGDQMNMLAKVLPRFSKEQLDRVMKALDLEKVMYESDAFAYSDIDYDGDGLDLFNSIMDQADAAGLLTAEEVLLWHLLASEYGYEIESYGTEAIEAVKRASGDLGFDFSKLLRGETNKIPAYLAQDLQLFSGDFEADEEIILSHTDIDQILSNIYEYYGK